MTEILRRDGNARNSALRRYPALGYLAGAVALTLLLPSGLTLPNSGPSTLAEYAPVPGQGQGTGDVSELGQASSSGGHGFGARPPEPTTADRADTQGGSRSGRTLRQPGTKRCVGNPPRQTEDPVSPPCVAFFDGDNGGATTKGVTREEVRVVIVNDSGSGEMELACDGDPRPEDVAIESACRAFMKFFNARYQTYGRTVRLWTRRNAGGGTQDAYAEEIDKQRNPFAVVPPLSTYSGYVSPVTSRKMFFASFYGVARDRHTAAAPYAIAYRPDTSGEADMVAAFVCTKLSGRPPRFGGTTGPKRVFGLWVPNGRNDLLERRLKDRCGESIAERGDSHSTTTGGRSDAVRMASAGVTTVLIDAPSGNLNVATRAATQAGWFPEWVLAGSGLASRNDSNRTARAFDPAQWSSAVGPSFDSRRDSVAEQPWSNAYFEGCPTCPPQTTALGSDLYETLSMLFYGIQAAGPRLTPENFDKGMHAIPQRGSPNPYKPAAYFGPGDYTYIKDAMAIWWDATGQGPGDPQPGCWRLVDGGRRSRPDEWTPGDADLHSENPPCQGPVS